MSVPTSIRDNRAPRGSAADFLRGAMIPESKLSFVSAYFTVHAYNVPTENDNDFELLTWLVILSQQQP